MIELRCTNIHHMKTDFLEAKMNLKLGVLGLALELINNIIDQSIGAQINLKVKSKIRMFRWV